MTRTRLHDRRLLATGAALVACALASTEAKAQTQMYFSSISNFQMNVSIGSATFAPYSVSGPTTYFFNYSYVDIGGVYYTTRAFAEGYLNGSTQEDGFTLMLRSDVNANFISTGSFDITFTGTVAWTDLYSDAPSNWTVDGVLLSDGDVLGAGTYTLAWSLNTLGNPVPSGYAAGVAGWFTQVGGVVPLPGAAGLAACGLVGLHRRRRR